MGGWSTNALHGRTFTESDKNMYNQKTPCDIYINYKNMYDKKTLCDIYIQFMNILDLIACLKDPTGLLGVNVFGHLEYKLHFMMINHSY